MKSRVLLIGALVLIGVAAAVGYVLFQSDAPSVAEEESADQGSHHRSASIPSEVLEKRGPRPPVGRIIDGSQVESREDALSELDESIAKVEEEIESAGSEEKREALKRKKRLIEIARDKISAR